MIALLFIIRVFHNNLLKMNIFNMFCYIYKCARKVKSISFWLQRIFWFTTIGPYRRDGEIIFIVLKTGCLRRIAWAPRNRIKRGIILIAKGTRKNKVEKPLRHGIRLKHFKRVSGHNKYSNKNWMKKLILNKLKVSAQNRTTKVLLCMLKPGYNIHFNVDNLSCLEFAYLGPIYGRLCRGSGLSGIHKITPVINIAGIFWLVKAQ